MRCDNALQQRPENVYREGRSPVRSNHEGTRLRQESSPISNLEDSLMKTTLARHAAALLACAALSFAAPAFAQDKTVKIGVLNDMSSLYADIGGPNSVVAIKMAVEDSGLHQEGLDDRRRQRRSPEQARCRRQHRPAMDRQRQGRCDRRYAEFRRRARREQHRQGKERGAAQFRRGDALPLPARPARRIRSRSPTTPTCSPPAPARR